MADREKDDQLMFRVSQEVKAEFKAKVEGYRPGDRYGARLKIAWVLDWFAKTIASASPEELRQLLDTIQDGAVRWARRRQDAESEGSGDCPGHAVGRAVPVDQVAEDIRRRSPGRGKGKQKRPQTNGRP